MTERTSHHLDRVLAIDGDGTPVTARLILAAYAHGLYPMANDPPERFRWYQPRTRAVITADTFRVPASLRRVLRRAPFEIRFDHDFEAVVAGCASRAETWIDADIARMYTAMHEFGLAHSVSAYDRATGELVGGLYGLAVGGCFSGESMFHRVPNASMVCLAELTQRLFAAGFLLHDCQQMTPHVERCGAREVPQAWFVRQMTALVAVQPDWAKVSREDGPDASSPTE